MQIVLRASKNPNQPVLSPCYAPRNSLFHRLGKSLVTSDFCPLVAIPGKRSSRLLREFPVFFADIREFGCRDRFALHCVVSQPVSSLAAMSGSQEYSRYFRELARECAVSEAHPFQFSTATCRLSRPSLWAPNFNIHVVMRETRFEVSRDGFDNNLNC